MPARIIPLQIYQNTISKALERMSKTDDISEVFSDVMTEVLNYYKAGRVVIMSTIPETPDYQTCLFEVDAPGVQTTMYCMGGVFPKSKWRYLQIESGKSIIVDDTQELGKNKYLAHGIATLKKTFDRLGVRSHMAVPIRDFYSRPSFLCVDINDRPYHWTSQDERFIRDIANLIMNWGKLQASNRRINEEKEYLRSVMEKIPVGLALYDKEGKLTYANEKVMRVFGIDMDPKQVKFNLFKSQILSDYELDMIRKKETFDSVFEYGYGHKPAEKNDLRGDNVRVLAKYSRLLGNDGKLKAYLAAYVDRTQETSASNKVKELDGFVSTCAGFAKIGFARVNVISKIGFGTMQWFQNFGIDNSDGKHSYKETINRLHPDDRKQLMDYRSVVIIDPSVTFRKRLRVMKDDGSGEFDYLQFYSVVTRYEPQNGIVETSTITHNINRYVEMEQMLRAARDQAEKADKLKSAFLANMSHEIRTPLNAIVGFSQLLCDNMVEEEERPEVMSIIENNNSLLLQLISDILDLAKLEAGTLEFHFQETELNALCRSVAQSVRMRLKPGVELIVDCPLEELPMTTDPNRVKQVLINFATNAAKFTDKGHVRIGYALQDDACVKLYVEDTGIGISRDKISRVFDRFVKLNSFEQGNGLGLQISREIVAKLDGRIGADSEPGKGSTFWCVIPLRKHNVKHG